MTPRPALYPRQTYDTLGGNGVNAATYGRVLGRTRRRLVSRVGRTQVAIKQIGRDDVVAAILAIDTFLDLADDLHGNDQGPGPA